MTQPSDRRVVVLTGAALLTDAQLGRRALVVSTRSEPDTLETFRGLCAGAMRPATPAPSAPLCMGKGELFFSDDFDEALQAKALCWSCPLQALCLQKALRTPGDSHGVQGGYDALERGYYKRLHGTTVSRVEALDMRYLTKRPKSHAA